MLIQWIRLQKIKWTKRNVINYEQGNNSQNEDTS